MKLKWDGCDTTLPNQFLMEHKMAAISAGGSNPFVTFGNVLEKGGFENFNKIQEAKSAIADQMAHFKISRWDDQDLKSLAENATTTDDDGNTVQLPDSVKAMAKRLLDNGGSSALNPSGDPWFSQDDLRR